MIATVLLQAAGSGSMFGSWGPMLPMVGIIIVFYFFMIRPQMKKAKTEKDFKEQLQKGDKVVTTAGIHGRIVDLNETTFLVEVDNGKIRFDKSAISLEASKALNTPPVAAKA